MDSNKIHIIMENNKKVRHDIRGAIFTLNTSLFILEKNPDKLGRLNKILKNTVESINNTINEWKEKDEKIKSLQ